MKNASKSLCVTIALALFLTISMAYSAYARTSASTAAKAAALQEDGIYTIKEAGLQFEVPKGWKVEKQDNGNLVLSVEDGAVTVTFVVEDKYEEVLAGMKSGLKEKVRDLKSDGEPKEDTHNSMVHIAETGTGSIKDTPSSGASMS